MRTRIKMKTLTKLFKTFYTSTFVMVQYVSRVGSKVWHTQCARVKQEISAYLKQVGSD
jgi:hypothetical protein